MEMTPHQPTGEKAIRLTYVVLSEVKGQNRLTYIFFQLRSAWQMGLEMNYLHPNPNPVMT